jgi:RPA family protein
MNYAFFLLPLSVVSKSNKGLDENGSFIEFEGNRIYRLHVVGSVVTVDINEDGRSGYAIIDDTSSSILAHFQSTLIKEIEKLARGDLVEVVGYIDIYNESVTLSMVNIKGISVERYAHNKIESIKNMKALGVK